jgi:ribosome maturation factor RimP
MRNNVVERIEDIARRVADSAGLEIVEVELKGSGKARALRIFIDKPEGVTHADCELVSQEVGTILDVEDVIPGGSYNLEVSSPGVERKLRKPGDFERFTGKKVKVVLREPVEGSNHWEGLLCAAEGGLIRLDVGNGRVISFTFDAVSRANLKFEW